MKNNVKIVIAFIIGSIITGTIVYATGGLTARNVGYGNDTLKSALDDLYKKADRQQIETRKVCEYQSEGSFGAKGTVGAKYKCQLGANDKDSNDNLIYRYFYILAINNDNTVDLIMDRNITEGSSPTTMTWMNAMKYFRTGAGVTYKNKWVNVLDVGLPSAQDIANAVGNTGWNMEEKNYNGWFYFDKNGTTYGQTQVASSSNLSSYRWLFNYTRECSANGCDSTTSLGSTEAYGYWTRDIIAQQLDSTGRAWHVNRSGNLIDCPVSYDTYHGVRPVITLLQSNLYD